MDTSLKLQLDVKNNAQELQNFMRDLNNWEEEMKRKEKNLTNEKPKESIIPPPRNKSKRCQTVKKYSEKPKKISAYDYSAWDKFDVERALAEIDEEDNDESAETELEESTKFEEKGYNLNESGTKDKEHFSLIDEAFYEKEMGNKFAKNEQWADAIKCYTNAISLDPNNPIYFANRSLCFLKLKNFKSSETDATVAIQLDKKYVKAYQRRAFSRLALGQLREAKSDFNEVLKLEPKNALAIAEISKIDEKLKKEQGLNVACGKKTKLSFNPKNMFKNEILKSEFTEGKKQPQIKTTGCIKSDTVISKPKSKVTEESTEHKMIDSNVDSNDNMGEKNEARSSEKGDGDKVVLSQSSETKSEVFKPLPEWCKIIQPINIPPHKRSKKPFKRISIEITDQDEDVYSMSETRNECMNVVKAKEEKINICKKIEDEKSKNERLSFDVPKTAIQFYNCWKILKHSPENSYCYLKKIPTTKLPEIFENSLESNFFSEIVTFLASDEVKKDPEVIYNFLWGFSKVKRFSSLILFMSEADKKCLRKAVSHLETVKSDEDLCELLKLYELKV